MRALEWDGQRLTFSSSHGTPTLNAGSALVQVHLAGICSTDLQILKGYMGFIGVPGHEFVGTVRAGPGGFVGKRVVGEINFGCGDCDSCRRDLSRHCPHRRVMGIVNADGAFAEYLSVPVGNLHAVPESVDNAAAVFAEPLAAAFEILTQIQLNPGDEVLVLGDGKLGNLCAQVLRLTGARITALGKHVAKLSMIKKAGVRTILLDDWRPRLFDVVVEATGSAGGFELALGAVRPRGMLVLKSTLADIHQVSLAPIVINEIKVIGSRCGPFADALEALAARQVSVTPLIDKVYDLVDGVDGLRHAAQAGAKKILLRP